MQSSSKQGLNLGAFVASRDTRASCAWRFGRITDLVGSLHYRDRLLYTACIARHCLALKSSTQGSKDADA
jgi:hypothetical protein